MNTDWPEWHHQRAHVNHMDGRRRTRLYDIDRLELLCQWCHAPNGEHAPTQVRMDRLLALAAKAKRLKREARP